MGDALSQRLEYVQERIDAAARRAGRDPSEVALVAVTKMRTTDEIVAAVRLGLLHFGENRVEEAVRKIPQVRASLTEADPEPTWHMVGHLQRRKVRNAVRQFDWIHSVDRLAVAREISKRCMAARREIPALLEINVSGEEQKYGFRVSGGIANHEAVEALCRDIEQIVALPGLTIHGLMTMAPFEVEAEKTRPVFRMMRELRDELQTRFPLIAWEHLSMGMTNDFEVAIEEGATMVRIGTAIFGPRKER